MVLFIFSHISTAKMKNCSSETDSVQFFQCNLKTRIPLKVIQIQSFYKDIFKMNVSNKNERANSYLAFSKQPNHTSLNKGSVRSSEHFRGKSTVNKIETYDHALKSGTPRKGSSCDISEKLTDTSFKNIPATTHNEKNDDSFELSGSRVGSLTSSPKWSRIKDKFENVELNSKTKICRSSSLPRSDDESLQIKRDFSRASSRSLTSLSFENNLSTAKTSVVTKLPTYKKCAIVDRRECAAQRIANKSISSNDSPRNSTHETIKFQTKKLPVSVKIDESENKATVTKTHRVNHTPLSARSAASALLLASSRTNNTVSKTSHGLRESNSVVPKKISLEKSIVGCAPKLLPKSSAKDNFLSTTNKNIRTPVKNSKNLKFDHESSKRRGLDKSEQKSITKSSVDENEQESPANKVLGKNEPESMAKKTIGENEHENAARKGLDKFEPRPVASSDMNCSIKILPENVLHIKSETDKIDKSKLMPVKGTDLHGINFTGIKDQPADKISTSLLTCQMSKDNKSIWVKDSVGSWKKAPASVATSHQQFKNPSKVAQLRSKFNSCVDEKSVQKVSDLSTGKRNFLLKSSTTSCVPVKINDIYDANVSNRQMSKSVTTNSIFNTVNPSQLVGHDDQSITIRNVASPVGETKLKKQQHVSSVSAPQSHYNSHLVLENSLSSSEGSSPDSCHKLSLVQRAILSYEGNLSLLSPETQRKLRLLGGRVEAETDDDKLLVAKAKNNMLTVNAIKSTSDSSHCSSQVEGPETGVIKNQHNMSSHEERVGQPIRSFLCRYQNTNKQAKENKTTNMPREVELNRMQRSDGISKKHEFTPISLVPSFHRSENGASEVKCIGMDSTDILGAKNGSKTLNSIFYIDNPDKKSLYANYTGNNSNISQKQNQLLSQVPIGNEKIDQPLRPNSSFLWRDTSIELNSEKAVKSVSPKVRMESKEENYYDLENYYSLIDNPDEAQFKSNEKNNKCSDTEQCSHYAFGSKSVSQSERNLKSHSSEYEDKELLDVDDGWTDLSDQDIYSQEAGSKTNLLSNTLRRKRNKKCGNRKSHLRRSWSQSLRDVTNSSYYEKAGWPKEECRYGTCTESSTHEQDSDSDADGGEHFYEPVYESLTNYLISKKPDDECHGAGQSSECETSKVFIKSHTSLELTDKLPVSDTCSETASEVQTDCSETTAGISKKAGEKIRQLKRHLSWTKNDFKLELSSKFNKIKIQKDLHSGTEIGVRVHEDNTCDNPKKKTFIKCILKQKHTNAAVKRIPSPKKENSLFYVHLSLSREKQRPFSDSCVGERIPPENAEKENGFQTSRKKSEQSLSFAHSDNTAQQPAKQLRKGSSGTIIQRPKTPPPLPPTNHVPKKSGKTNSPDIHETDSSIYKTLDKGMSLDSAYRSNSSNDSDSISFDNSFINFNVKETSEVPDINSHHQITEVLDANTEEKDLEEDLEFRFENKDSLTSLSSIIDCFSTSILFSQRTRGSLASSASGDSYAPADESGSSGGASSTVYSSGITPPASEADIGEYNDRSTSFNSDFNLTLFSDFKNELLKSPFEEEPMYQFYHKDVQQRATLWYTTDGSESEFEDDIINKTIEKDVVPASKPPVLQSQLSAMELIHGEGGQRTLWCEVPEVQNSDILENISAQDRKIQEAMFEVITSEASYLKSLNFLIEHFVQCPELSGEYADKHILDKRERHILFSDVPPVRDVSARLLADLEKRWLENIVLSNVCDIICHHANQYFSVYVKYCSNQLYQDRTLKELKENRPEFVEVLKKLESCPVCQGLDMHSFLMLPMQRITRLPLLVDAIFHRLSVDSPIYESCKMSLAVLNKIVAECNEGARNMQRMEEMLVISRQLDFRKCKGLGLLSASRWLVKKGELIRLLLETTNRRTFVRNNWCKVHLYLFLFTDVLVVTRKKSDDTYCVVDYCSRNMVQVIPVDENKFPSNARRPSSYRNLFQMTMLHNQDGKMVEMLLSCPLESDRTRWMDAVTPAISENPDEKIYEEWDCPQVQCNHMYIAQQPDELSLEEADVVNVFRKMADGWYEGERIRDGVRGWFPSSHTVEIVSSHVRARNLRQRYRLLMLSQTYLEEQQKAQAAAHGKGK